MTDGQALLHGRRLLITGASSGIGAATARAARAAGAELALLARRRDLLDDLAGQLQAVDVPADVTDPRQARAAVDAAADALGGLDGVVNAAGIARPARIADADPADWAAMLDVNVRGLLQVTQAAIPHLRAAGRGDVVNVSSMSGRRVASSELAVYAGTKAAVHMLSEGLRRELAEDGIRVSVLAPGFVATHLFEQLAGTLANELDARARRIGLPVERVADAVVRILAAPPDVVHVEVALVSLEQQ